MILLLATLGGLALFLIGIGRIVQAMQAMAGGSAQRAMASATSSPWRALATGTVVSAATQSGTATAATALGLVASGFVAVREGLVMSLGAQIGATVAIQLAAFRISEYALPLVAIGFLLAFHPRLRAIGGLVLGAGLLFLGLGITVEAMAGLREGAFFEALLTAAERQPLALVAVGFALGSVLTSSNAVAALGLGLFAVGGLTLPAAIAFVAGGNVGGTIIAIVAARSLDVNAERVAVTHTMVKAAGAVLLAFVAVPAAALVAGIGGDGARQIANAHTLFNLAVALPATVLATPLTALATRLMPAQEDSLRPKYLRAFALEDAPLATALALRETVRISDHVAVMTAMAVGYLRRGHWDVDPIMAREAKIDRLTQDVVDYLAQLRRRHGNDPTTERLLLLAIELEHMGDQIERLREREEKLRAEGVEFSRRGRRELADTLQLVHGRMRDAFTALATFDPALAASVESGKAAVAEHIAAMRLAHLSRLEARLPESRASSGRHLEMLVLLLQLNSSVSRVARWTGDLARTREGRAAEAVPTDDRSAAARPEA
jgi:phosphate:Na+ symporter